MNTYTQTVHTRAIKLVQNNLHHSKAATANLCQQLAEGKALIQEPWIYV
jgi:hypothetical protein